MIRIMQYYEQLARKLAHGGKYRTLLVNCPETPEIFEYIAQKGNVTTHYINVDAQAGANIIRIVTD